MTENARRYAPRIRPVPEDSIAQHGGPELVSFGQATEPEPTLSAPRGCTRRLAWALLVSVQRFENFWRNDSAPWNHDEYLWRESSMPVFHGIEYAVDERLVPCGCYELMLLTQNPDLLT